MRLVFVADKPDGASGLQAFELPLAYISEEDFKQPIFFANNLSGRCGVAALLTASSEQPYIFCVCMLCWSHPPTPPVIRLPARPTKCPPACQAATQSVPAARAPVLQVQHGGGGRRGAADDSVDAVLQGGRGRHLHTLVSPLPGRLPFLRRLVPARCCSAAAAL